MKPEQQARKLRMIAALPSLLDVQGWRQGVEVSGRDWFPGEAAALVQREKELRKPK